MNPASIKGLLTPASLTALKPGLKSFKSSKLEAYTIDENFVLFAIFDNSKKHFSLDYDEVIITRKVYRDGVNEYFLNSSQVRLKDIIELLAGIGLGASGHHIIAQGESDRILYASPKDRREMIEDALGLKIYQLKRAEAERKLEHTQENIRQIEGLRKEIQPHLRFLKTQVNKFRAASELREKLKNLYQIYLSKENACLNQAFKSLLQDREKPERELAEIEKEIKSLQETLSGAKRDVAETDELRKIEAALEDMRTKRFSLERELGRLEGRIEIERSRIQESKTQTIERGRVEKLVDVINKHIKEGLLAESLNKVRQIFQSLQDALQDFLSSIDFQKPSESSSYLQSIVKQRKDLLSKLEDVCKKESELVKQHNNVRAGLTKKQSALREAERKMYQLESKANKLRDTLRSFVIEEEKLKLRKSEFERECEEARRYADIQLLESHNKFLEGEREKMRKDIERLKIKLEDSGGIDPSIMKEYEEVSKRDEFLGNELQDLRASTSSLRGLIKELSEKLEYDFETGIEKINREFGKFLSLIHI